MVAKTVSKVVPWVYELADSVTSVDLPLLSSIPILVHLKEISLRMGSLPRVATASLRDSQDIIGTGATLRDEGVAIGCHEQFHSSRTHIEHVGRVRSH